MSSKLKTSVLALGLMGVLGGGLAFAQTAPATPEAAPEATTEAAPAPAVTIPEILQGDAFADVESSQGRRGGMFVQGSLTESGKDFQAMVNSDGQLMGIRTAEGSALPQSVIDALLPETARANPILGEITELNAIGTRGGAVMVSGQAASGDKVRIGFDAEGELTQFMRGDHGKRDMGMNMGERGDRGNQGKRGMGDRGGDHAEQRGKGRGGEHGMMRGERGDRGQMRPREGQMAPREGAQMGPREGAATPPAPIDEASLRSAVEAAGYTELGAIAPTPGRGITIEALNPQGEEVVIVVSPKGEVMRESAR